jgi:3-hydroxyisobutyrate dehydrogenase
VAVILRFSSCFSVFALGAIYSFNRDVLARPKYSPIHGSIMISKPKVAFIGLGAMGIGMALHLLEDGLAVAGYDLNPKALETLKSKGGIVAASPRESADGASILVCVVGNAHQCKSVLLAESTGAAGGLPQDAVIVLCSTVPPEFPKLVQSWLDNDFNRPDIKVIDCPISGGTVRAAQGKLTILSSGSKEALGKANSVLSSMSQYLYEISGGWDGPVRSSWLTSSLLGYISRSQQKLWDLRLLWDSIHGRCMIV